MRSRAVILALAGGLLSAAFSGCSVTTPADEAAVVVAMEQPRPLGNLHLVEPGLYSGAAPEGRVAFDALAALGVRTVLAVDALPPDLGLAAERGIRVVHVPIAYDGAGPEAEAKIVRVIRDLPRPVYVHCHHGRHRGPAAVAFAQVALGHWTPGDARRAMEGMGTSHAYDGLYRMAEEAMLPAAPALAAIGDDDLASRAPVPSLAALMASIDRALDRVERAAVAGWKPLAEHPDLAPVPDAAALTDLLRQVGVEGSAPERAGRDPRFEADAAGAAAAALRLEAAVRAADLDDARDALRAMRQSCRACHDRYR